MNIKKFVLGIAATFLMTTAFAGKFNICLGSFSKFENATNYMKELTLEGYATAIEPTVVNGKIFYRILLAETFDTMAKANKTRDDFSFESGKDDIWIMNADFSKKSLPSTLVLNARTAEPNVFEPKIEESKEELARIKAEIASAKAELNGIKSQIAEKNAEIAEIEKSKAEIEEERNELERKKSEAELSLLKIEDNLVKDEPVKDEEPVSVIKIEPRILKTQNDSETIEEVAFVPTKTIRPSTSAEVRTEVTDTVIADLTETLDGKLIPNSFDNETDEIDFVGKSEIPTTITENVKKLIKTFPMNKNFVLEGVSFFDFDNIRDGGLKIDTKSVDKIETPYEQNLTLSELESVHAASLGRFEDKDFSAKLSVMMLQMEDTDLETFTNDNNFNYTKDFEVDFKIGEENFNCFIAKSKKDSSEYKLFGENEDKSIFITIQADDSGKDWINRFIVGQKSAKEDALKNEFIKKSLLSLPDEEESLDRRFLSFDLSLSGDTVEREEGFKNKEHWNASASFDQEDTVLRIGFFDID